ncbi:TetR/AcrR family transcriptional regulator [Streptomyces formicae]|uniref:TetR/AcrR family transcriptional regulator n=1 Tax=Streptomyces formicae TaxID=1616117 RepID=A0ABY3WH03_9ACTN|nr:TetR/AcrR family transcriptional regulator [Streptomyces formicae]UNM11854.1 TetR/AcrR family transcriptional regulator [Streptomyces formicae]
MAKQERAARTHERFLDASADEFSRHGYAGANLQRIAAHVGMTKGALYAHFPSKDALAAAFTSAFDKVWHELLREICEGDPPLTNLRRVTVGFAHRLHTDLRFRAGLRLAYEEACTRGKAPAVVDDLSAALTRLVGDAQAREELTDAHTPEAISSLILSLIFGMYYTAPSNPLCDVTEQVCQVWQLFSPSTAA